MSGMNALHSQEEVSEFEELLNKVSSGTLYSDMFKIGVNLSLRLSDLLGLRYEDVLGKDELRLKVGKTKRDLVLPVSPIVRKIVEDRYSRFPDREFICESDKKRYAGKPVSSSIVQRNFKRVNDLINKPDMKYNTHTMRKSKAALLYAKGVSVETISKMLDHNDTKVTLRYIDVLNKDVKDAMLGCEFEF